MSKEPDTLVMLQRIESLLTVLVKIQLSDVLKEELADEEKKQLYTLTGKHGVTKLAKKTGFSAGKISGLWQRWEGLGLLVKKGKQYVKVI